MPVVYCYLVMDILHRGHLRLLRTARGIAGSEGTVIAGILTDEAAMEKKAQPIMPYSHRAEIARSLKFIDRVVMQENYTPFFVIKRIRPDVLLESTSHDTRSIAEAERIMSGLGGSVVVIPYLDGISSTALKERIRGAKL